MATIAGVDPGLRACGVALVDGKSLQVIRAGLVKNPEAMDAEAIAWREMGKAVSATLSHWLSEDADGGCAVDLLVVEHMAIRGNPKTGQMITKNPGTMMGLASVCGAVLGAVAAVQVTAVYPVQWRPKLAKGHGDEYADLIWQEMSHAERARVDGAQLKTTGHNIIDAIGMAKWGARRFKLALI